MNKYLIHFMTFKKFYYLFTILVNRDIKKKYKGSVLGILWSLINPLLNMIVLTIVFSTIFKNSIDNFPVYLLSGRLLYSFFEGATSASLKSIINSSSLLKKVYVPKYLMTLSGVTSNFITFLISLIALMFVMIATGAEVNFYILYAPVFLLLLFVFVCGLSLVLSTITIFFRDLVYIYQVITHILVYTSAIFYPSSIIPEKFQFILLINPVFHYISGFRQAVYLGAPPDLMNLLICFLLAIISLFIGVLVFEKNQDKFILYI
ncbi:ABC transporter permease [Paenibacillus barengoltzii]|uniref:Transport permease protein n=1 Tax=Paenibacillus barengoltzii G22 TaxID=1235795 RepID=R9L5U9_9BACL|nr:ABC transporter permease [Paenibacillus barengoltzii]EOS54055.1 hypothetical protein C812_03686 [Paenibacillus barengoltzii G22]